MLFVELLLAPVTGAMVSLVVVGAPLGYISSSLTHFTDNPLVLGNPAW